MNQPQNIFITGSSSGFGRLIARTLLTAGHTVLATMRDSEGRNRERAADLRTFAADQPGTLHVSVPACSVSTTSRRMAQSQTRRL